MDRTAPTDPNQEALRKVMAEKKRIKVEAQQWAHELARATVKSEIERRHTAACDGDVAARLRRALQNTDGDMVIVHGSGSDCETRRL
jgi:hypothetical protein